MNNMPQYWIDWVSKFTDKQVCITEDVSNKTAVIVEPRKQYHLLLKYVIYNFMYLLSPYGWGLHVFCGKGNKQKVESLLPFRNRNVLVTELDRSNLTLRRYNLLLTDYKFYESILNKPEYILIFQTDTLLFNGDLSRFMNGEYDFVGAPWKHHPNSGANGGLSLRRLNTMIEICKKFKIHPYDSEDGFFSLKVREPPFDVKKQFSMETIWSDNPFGLHKAYEYQDMNRLKTLLESITI
jgi:hypothetical protein